MGMEVADSDAVIYDADEGDSEAFSSVVEVLEAKCKKFPLIVGSSKCSFFFCDSTKAPHMVSPGDTENYDFLVDTLDPSKKMNPEEEAFLVTELKALSGAVFSIDVDYHWDLLSNIFDMSVWKYGLDVRNALLELVIALASVPDKFLDNCLHMLVGNFVPPRKLIESLSETKWLAKKKEVHGQLHMAFHYISELVPLAPVKLKDVIDRRMPRHTDPKEVIFVFAECMLGLVNHEIGEFLGSALLAKVVDLLTDLDVNISWEDILQEDHNKGLFDMELEDGLENAGGDGRIGTKLQEEAGILKGNDFADKLDGLMVIICEHLKIYACNGRLLKVFEALMESFRKTVLNAYKSKFCQFMVFYACSLDPEKCGKMFADFLTDIFVSTFEDPISRMSAVAYLASYLSRAKFISPSQAANKLKRLVEWCLEYCRSRNGREINPMVHRIFYSGCQAILYVLCFRMKSMIDSPELRPLLFGLHLEVLLHHPLAPLKVCLPTIVDEFLLQATSAGLVSSPMPIRDVQLDSSLSKAFGGQERLDMFFPFDPYLLRESDRFMRPIFEFWRMVRTPYGCGIEDEDDNEDTYSENAIEDEYNEDPGGAHIPDNVATLADHENSDSEEDLDLTMDKMSITPKLRFRRHSNAVLHNRAQMPARLEPSVSPPNW